MYYLHTNNHYLVIKTSMIDAIREHVILILLFKIFVKCIPISKAVSINKSNENKELNSMINKKHRHVHIIQVK